MSDLAYRRRYGAVLVCLAVLICSGSAFGESGGSASAGDTRVRPADGVEMVAVPAGTFQMGSTLAQVDDAIALCREHYRYCNRWYYMRENPKHPVTLSRFWLDRTEITNAQYRRCVEDGVCQAPTTCKKGDPTWADEGKSDHPVVCVSWHDARAYCEWAGARLPTEAEWEYAFRGESSSNYPWGDTFDGARLNYCDVNCTNDHADDRYDDGFVRSSPAGRHLDGAAWSGALGMGGNVAEWVADWLGEYSAGASIDPIGPADGSEKVVKGCSWFSQPAYCRGATRGSVAPETRFDYFGFRCAASRQEPDDLIFEAPQGKPPAIDGTLSPGEWADARRVELPSGELLFMSDGNDLYVGIRSEVLGLGSPCILRNDEISVLHSSAALGTATYVEAEGEKWKRTRTFNWTCRDTSMSERAVESRRRHLEEENWLASNGNMGERGEMEYQIAMIDGEVRLAVTYLKGPNLDTTAVWPAHLADGCREIELVQGDPPDSLSFAPDTWMTVTAPAARGRHAGGR